MEFCEALPRTAAGRHIGDQLLRSATSVAANYAEASEAESPADFVHKLKLAQKELKESRVWLLFAARLFPGDAVESLKAESLKAESLKAESRELLLMIGKSINTASARMQGKAIGA
jgi:four helix bundle protein